MNINYKKIWSPPKTMLMPKINQSYALAKIKKITMNKINKIMVLLALQLLQLLWLRIFI